MEDKENFADHSRRKARFAALAASLDDWEDDSYMTKNINSPRNDVEIFKYSSKVLYERPGSRSNSLKKQVEKYKKIDKPNNTPVLEKKPKITSIYPSLDMLQDCAMFNNENLKPGVFDLSNKSEEEYKLIKISPKTVVIEYKDTEVETKDDGCCKDNKTKYVMNKSSELKTKTCGHAVCHEDTQVSSSCATADESAFLGVVDKQIYDAEIYRKPTISKTALPKPSFVSKAINKPQNGLNMVAKLPFQNIPTPLYVITPKMDLGNSFKAEEETQNVAIKKKDIVSDKLNNGAPTVLITKPIKSSDDNGSNVEISTLKEKESFNNSYMGDYSQYSEAMLKAIREERQNDIIQLSQCKKVSSLKKELIANIDKHSIENASTPTNTPYKKIFNPVDKNINNCNNNSVSTNKNDNINNNKDNSRVITHGYELNDLVKRWETATQNELLSNSKPGKFSSNLNSNNDQYATKLLNTPSKKQEINHLPTNKNISPIASTAKIKSILKSSMIPANSKLEQRAEIDKVLDEIPHIQKESPHDLTVMINDDLNLSLRLSDFAKMTENFAASPLATPVNNKSETSLTPTSSGNLGAKDNQNFLAGSSTKAQSLSNLTPSMPNQMKIDKIITYDPLHQPSPYCGYSDPSISATKTMQSYLFATNTPTKSYLQPNQDSQRQQPPSRNVSPIYHFNRDLILAQQHSQADNNLNEKNGKSTSSLNNFASLSNLPYKTYAERIMELEGQIERQQSIIKQISQALLLIRNSQSTNNVIGNNNYNKTPTHSKIALCSFERIEAEKLNFIARQKRELLIKEIGRLKAEEKAVLTRLSQEMMPSLHCTENNSPSYKAVQLLESPFMLKQTDVGNGGSNCFLNISSIKLLIKPTFIENMSEGASPNVSNLTYYFLCVFKYGPHLVFTQLTPWSGNNFHPMENTKHFQQQYTSININNCINLHGITASDWQIEFEVFAMYVKNVNSESMHAKSGSSKFLRKINSNFLASPTINPMENMRTPNNNNTNNNTPNNNNGSNKHHTLRNFASSLITAASPSSSSFHSESKSKKLALRKKEHTDSPNLAYLNNVVAINSGPKKLTENFVDPINIIAEMDCTNNYSDAGIFVLNGFTTIHQRDCANRNRTFKLKKVPQLSPLEGTVLMSIKCHIQLHHRGFLSMFELINGLGSWNRLWFVLTGQYMCYWKYPEHEAIRSALGRIDLSTCVDTKVDGPLPFDKCARPNTFELSVFRESFCESSIISESDFLNATNLAHNSQRFLLSADNKEQLLNWCEVLNQALANLNTWDKLYPTFKLANEPSNNNNIMLPSNTSSPYGSAV